MRATLVVITLISLAWGATREATVQLVPVALPLPIAVAAPPAPAPPVRAPEPPRAVTPRPACILETLDHPCDVGLPAISRAGDTVAVLAFEEDATGLTIGAAIEWRDARSLRRLRRVPIATARDVANVEALLAGYRSLLALERAGLRLERDDTAKLRVVDVAANALLLEDELAVAPDAHGLRGAAIADVRAWFDADRRLLFGAMAIGDGHGPTVAEYFVRTLPAP